MNKEFFSVLSINETSMSAFSPFLNSGSPSNNILFETIERCINLKGVEFIFGGVILRVDCFCFVLCVCFSLCVCVADCKRTRA